MNCFTVEFCLSYEWIYIFENDIIVKMPMTIVDGVFVNY